MLSTNGSINPSKSVKIVWGLAMSTMASIIVYFGGTQGLQNMLIIAALPFSIIMLLMGASFKAARYEVDVSTKRIDWMKKKNERTQKIG
jgi:glycine betaine transporter